MEKYLKFGKIIRKPVKIKMKPKKSPHFILVEKLENILQIRKNTLTNLEKWYNFGKLGKIHKIRKIPWKTQGKCKWDLKKRRKKRPSLNFDWWIQKNTQHLEKIFQTNSENKLRKILRITRKSTPQNFGSQRQNHFFQLCVHQRLYISCGNPTKTNIRSR